MAGAAQPLSPLPPSPLPPFPPGNFPPVLLLPKGDHWPSAACRPYVSAGGACTRRSSSFAPASSAHTTLTPDSHSGCHRRMPGLNASHAHGAGIILPDSHPAGAGGKYYMVGATQKTQPGWLSEGINMYSSFDLQHWKLEHEIFHNTSITTPPAHAENTLLDKVESMLR